MGPVTLSTAVLALMAGSAFGQATQPPVRALLLTGQNNHNWRYTSRVHQETLEATGRFLVDIADDTPAALSGNLDQYGLFVLDYNGPRWGQAAEQNFLEAVRNGKGVVVIHAANNAFPGWADYEKMVGLLWREGTGHGKFHEFDITFTTPDHPITRGLGEFKAHPDELYHNLANPQNAQYEVLATAFSSPESGGIGKDQPMAITLTFGQGRIFHTPLGHVWENQHHQKRAVSDPQFRLLLGRGAEWAATGAVTLGTDLNDARSHNQLSTEEKSAGWVLLFDGKSMEHFRGFRQQEFPSQGWVIDEGAIRHVAGQGGGDIITREQYEDFEFTCEWKVAPKGNSGIMYRSTEDQGATWATGPEMQVLDNGGHPDAQKAATSAGALYGLIPCKYDVIRPAGEWNTFRIVIQDNRVEHWANGFKIVEYELNSPQWDAMIKGTKFESMQGFGRQPRGHIALQDHGDDVWYRNIKIRPLP